jgi:uncharacterized membrane protein
MVTVRNSDGPWFNSELRREIRKRDRVRKTAKQYNKQSDIDKVKKQKIKVNNLQKIAKEHFDRRFRKLFHLVLRPELYVGEGVYYYILYSI